MAPMGATTCKNGNDQQQHAFSLLYVYSVPVYPRKTVLASVAIISISVVFFYSQFFIR